MPKAEKGSIKDIGKRIKAKGLQKLKFFCQMCEKQCRDANGFKCHLTSESHLRQMKVFSENAAGYMDQYSRDFEKLFLETLRMRHGTSQVNANQVYQQVIQDKHHVHMNSTIWATLTDFVKYLGKTGKCHVEENERGWYVTFIERDASKMARQEALQKRQAAELQAERLAALRMEQQRLAAAQAFDRATGADGTTTLTALQPVQATNLEPAAAEGKKAIHIPLLSLNSSNNSKKSKIKSKQQSRRNVSVFDDDDDDDDDHESVEEPSPPTVPLPLALPARSATTTKTAIDASTTTQQQHDKAAAAAAAASWREEKSDAARSTKRSRDDPKDGNDLKSKKPKSQHNDNVDDEEPWLYPDILVRIVNKRLDQFFNRKATVDRLVDKYTAEVIVLDSGPNVHDGGDVLQLDQNDLETVVPKQTGKMVRILRGEYRGKRAEVVELDGKKYRASLRIVSKSSSDDGLVLKKVDYADFSKLA